MSNAEPLTVTLPADVSAEIQAKVEQGGYASAEDVVLDAMRSWQDQERRFETLRRKIDEADLDPRPSIPDDLLGRYFEEKLARSLASRGIGG